MKRKVAAVGFSSSRLVTDTAGREDPEASRRVLFRVVTNAETQIGRFSSSDVVRLNVDLHALESAASRMRSGPVNLKIDVAKGLDPVGPIVIEPKDPIDIDDPASFRSDPRSGLLRYEDRPVVLYIQDHGFGIREVLADGSEGNKVHVADCSTLKEMRVDGRFDRYVATNNVNGSFYVTGQDEQGGREEGRARLMVCLSVQAELPGLQEEGSMPAVPGGNSGGTIHGAPEPLRVSVIEGTDGD